MFHRIVWISGWYDFKIRKILNAAQHNDVILRIFARLKARYGIKPLRGFKIRMPRRRAATKVLSGFCGG